MRIDLGGGGGTECTNRVLRARNPDIFGRGGSASWCSRRQNYFGARSRADFSEVKSEISPGDKAGGRGPLAAKNTEEQAPEPGW